MLIPRPLRALLRRPPAEPPPVPPADTEAALALRVEAASRSRFGRVLAIRHVDAGDCGGCALEIGALKGLPYDLARLGLRFVDSPRHADVLLVSGPVSRNMAEALRRAREAMPDPAWVVAAGDCAMDGGCFRGSDAVEGGAGAVLAVDLTVPGCPPTPAQLLEGLLALLRADVAHPAGQGDRPVDVSARQRPDFTPD